VSILENLLTRKANPQQAQALQRLEEELNTVKQQLHDVSTEDDLNYAIQAYGAGDEKSLDSFSGGNNLNYFGSIQQDIDLATLHRLFVTEGWFYVCVSTIAQSLCALPLLLEKKITVTERLNPEDPNSRTIKKDTWEDASGEPEAYLFKYPSDTHTASEFYELLIVDLLSTGNGYIHTRLDETRKAVLEMYRINSAMIEPIAGTQGSHIGGYIYRCPQGTFRFEEDEIIHIKMPNPVDPFIGLAPIVPVMKNVLLDRHTHEHMIRFYKQGARLGGVIKTTRKLTKDQLTRLQRSFDQDYTGKLNHHKTLILPEGMEYDTIESNMLESSMIEFTKANREPIFSAYKVPPVKAGLLEDASYSNALVQHKGYYEDCLKPIAKKIEESLNKHKKLLKPERSLRIRYDFSNVEALRENVESKGLVAKSMLDTGCTVNEVRQDIWKKAPLKGGDVSPVLEQAKNPSPIFAGAEAGEAKDQNGNPVAMPAGMPVEGPAVTAVMNVIRRVQTDKLTPGAAVEVLVSMFAMDRNVARSMVGFPPLPPHPPVVETPVEEGKNSEPNAQPDMANIGSTIVETDGITFEQRVAQLVEVALGEGHSMADAIRMAIERATLEGHVPTQQLINDPTEDAGKLGESEAAAENVIQFAANEQALDRLKVNKLSLEQVQTALKALTEGQIVDLMREREDEVKDLFKRMGQVFMKGWEKKVRQFGLHMKAKDSDDVVDEGILKDFIKQEKKKPSKAIENAMKHGYDQQLFGVRELNLPNEIAAQMSLEFGADNITYVTETTKADVSQMIADALDENKPIAEISADLRDYFEGTQSAARVQTIVRTETLSAVSLGQSKKDEDFKKEFPKEAKELKKIWIDAQDDRVRDDHKLNMEVVDVDEPFSNGLMFPREPRAEAGQKINCRCAWMSFLPEDEDSVVDSFSEAAADIADAAEEVEQDAKE